MDEQKDIQDESTKLMMEYCRKGQYGSVFAASPAEYVSLHQAARRQRTTSTISSYQDSYPSTISDDMRSRTSSTCSMPNCETHSDDYRSWSPSPSDCSQDLKKEVSCWWNGLRYFVISLLALVLVVAAVFVILGEEQSMEYKKVKLSEQKPLEYSLDSESQLGILRVGVRGNFLPTYMSDASPYGLFLSVVTDRSHKPMTRPWSVTIPTRKFQEYLPELEVFHDFLLPPKSQNNESLILLLETNEKSSVEIGVGVVSISNLARYGVHIAIAILIFLYTLILFEIVDRVVAALLAATCALAALSAFNERPTLEEIASWVDVETLLLLFSMMTLVSLLAETGIFHQAAIFAYSISRGRLWWLITLLSIITAVLSAFLDNVTTILLLTPITIKLCEASRIEAGPVLMILVMFSNIGGAATAVGDPPNVIIAANPRVRQAGIGYIYLTLHMGGGAILSAIAAYIYIRWAYRDLDSLNITEQPAALALKEEVAVWERVVGTLSIFRKGEGEVKKALRHRCHQLREQLHDMKSSATWKEEEFRDNLEELQKKFKISSYWAMTKAVVVVLLVIVLFFLASQFQISLGFVALLGALLLLLLAPPSSVHSALAMVEWHTLVFCSALFVLMESLHRLGLMKWVASWVQDCVGGVAPEYRLGVSIVLLIWVGGLASCLLDNIPLTTILLRVVLDLAEDLDLPLPPLLYTLGLAACLGGNGTLIGASANVVCVGVAQRHHVKISFMDFIRFGMPIVFITETVAMIYLLLCHVVFHWDF